MLSRFHLIPERYGRTDRQTDRIAISISRVSVLTRDKNVSVLNYIRLPLKSTIADYNHFGLLLLFVIILTILRPN